ncbi:alanine racemase [Carnobacterium alterfunditum]|uniref:Alanine racemase n=1 Tax=Carnobacterium alterfunditum TaxID=28230 RepID=A0A1N6FH19_9LACT|nr:alanine racemase [Carnobacterium alterfunditum]SIN94559.1 alanine racemase [Carnobacterium alterfunditum]
MKRESFRETWVEIALDNLEHNIKSFKKMIPPETALMAVVKADAYGHGSKEVAQTAIDAGATYLAVAFLDEALVLRKAGFSIPILVFGYNSLDKETIEAAIDNDITLTIYSEEAVASIQKRAEEKMKVCRIHLKVDSGMNRIGVRTADEALQIIASITSDYLILEGIFTHFADADAIHSTFVYDQFNHFMEIVSSIQKEGYVIPLKHCCNTAATIAFPEMHLDMVRVGIGIYGLYPEEHLRDKIELKPVMTFKTKPFLIKEVPAGQSISYGRTYTTTKDSIIATIPVGYADGFSRALSNKGHVTLNGHKAPIVGRVCMDQTMVDLTEIDSVAFNLSEEIVLFGDPSTNCISIGEVAKQMGTINYEVACLIGARVPRVYTTNK